MATIIHHETGYKADIYPAGRNTLHAWAFANARKLTFEGETISIAPHEYVITRKLEYFREGGSEKHLRDIKSMWELSRDAIDLDTLSQFLTERALLHLWQETTGAA